MSDPGKFSYFGFALINGPGESMTNRKRKIHVKKNPS